MDHWTTDRTAGSLPTLDNFHGLIVFRADYKAILSESPGSLPTSEQDERPSVADVQT